MKKLLTLLAIPLLTSCALIGSVMNPPNFDNVEYSKIVNIRMLTEETKECNITGGQVLISELLQQKISWLAAYAEFRPNNKQTQIMLRTFKLEADGFVEHSAIAPNPVYCQLKLENMHNQSIIIQRAFGIKRS